MKTITPLALASFSNDAEAKSDEDAVKQAVKRYVTAGDQRDRAAFGGILHDQYRVVLTVGAGGGVSVMPKDAYLGLIRDKKIGGGVRRVDFEWARPTGNLAFAKAKLTSKDASFDSLFTLVKKGGQWIVIEDAVRFDPEKR